MVETFHCPSCNASLDLPDPPNPTVRCPYCSRTVVVPEELRQLHDASSAEARANLRATAEIRGLLLSGRKIEAIKLFRQTFAVGLKEAKDAVEQMEAELEGMPVRPAEPAGAKASRGGYAGVVLILALAVGLGIAVFAFVGGESGSFQEALTNLGEKMSPANRTIDGTPLFLPGVDGAVPDIVFKIQNFDDDTTSFAYYDGATGALRWQSDTIARTSASPFFAADESRVFVAMERALSVYDRATGSLRWEAKMSDQIHAICVDCMMSFGGQLLGFTTDGFLQAFDAETGNPLWRLKIDPISSRRLFSLAAYVGVMNESEKAGMGIEILDPETGDLVQRLEPRCQHPTFDPQEPKADDPVVIDEREQLVTILFGFFEPGCVQQWAVDSGRMVWNSFTDLTSFSSDVQPLVGRNAIFVSDNQAGIFAIDKARGDVSLLASEEDYQLAPLAESGDVLLVRATSGRGTRRDELWAIDARAGGVIWRHLPQAAEMLAPGEEEVVWESGEGYWHARPTPRGIILMQARHQPARLLFETIDPLNGASSGQIELQVESQFDSNYRIGVIGWQGSIVWLKGEVPQIWAVETSAAEIVSRWP